jgi:hypothetical protein
MYNFVENVENFFNGNQKKNLTYHSQYSNTILAAQPMPHTPLPLSMYFVHAFLFSF